jgi:hypothetical protein
MNFLQMAMAGISPQICILYKLIPFFLKSINY